MNSLDDLLLTHHPRASVGATLNSGDVVELQGPAGSGKTQLLLFLAMTTALSYAWTVDLRVTASSRPARRESVALGGKGGRVVVFDTDRCFDLARLRHMIK